MAIIWQKNSGTTRYEVRQAGRSMRLYTNGVFHTQFHPQQLFTGSIWDLLSVPALLYPIGQIQRVLVLGVGGGTVINQLNYLISPKTIIGVELDKQHLYIAQRFFGLKYQNTRLYAQDAGPWIRDYDQAPFDLIIDDVFSEHEGQPVRAIDADKEWFSDILRVLAPNGMLVQNHPNWKSLNDCAYFPHRSIARRFKSAFHLSNPNLENAVGIFSRQLAYSADIRKRLNQLDNLPVSINRSKLKFRARKLNSHAQ